MRVELFDVGQEGVLAGWRLCGVDGFSRKGGLGLVEGG